MSPTIMNLVKPLFVLGFVLPYLHLALSTKYLTYLYLVFEGSVIFGVSMVPSALGILSLLLYLGKPLFWFKRWYSDIFTATIVSLTILPSLLFITSVIFLREFFEVSAKMYLAGVAVTVIILPWLILISQIESVVRLKESVALPAVGTVVAFGVVALLISAGTPASGTAASSTVASGTPKPEKIGDLANLGSNLLQQIGASIATMVSFLSHARILPDLQKGTSLEIGPERTWLGAMYVITTALYFYFRLYNPRDEQPDPTRPPKAIPRSFASVGLTVLAAVFVNLIILYIDSTIAVYLRPILNVSLIGALVILVFSIPKS